MKEQLKALLKKLGIYHPLQSAYRNSLSFLEGLRYKIDYRKYRGHGYTCNFCGASYSRFVPEYPPADTLQALESNRVIAGYGENVFCPNCMSKNRERLVKDVIDHYLSIRDKDVLHFSPEKHLYKYIRGQARVKTVDIEPGFYKTIDPAIVQGDATRLQYKDRSFDLIIANHILEHIPDDIKAMKEMWRVLKDDGVAILQAPWSMALAATIEDPFIADPEKQARLYGQKDHVRIYSFNEYVSRLSSAGFRVKVLAPESLNEFAVHAIQPGEPVVLGYKL